jgi:hypothetical protein
MLDFAVVLTIECRNCNVDIHVDEYRAHLDEEGESRQIHIYQICDKDFRVRIASTIDIYSVVYVALVGSM